MDNKDKPIECKHFRWDCDWYYCSLDKREMDTPKDCKDCSKYEK